MSCFATNNRQIKNLKHLLNKIDEYYREGFPLEKQCVKDLLGEIDDFFVELENQS